MIHYEFLSRDYTRCFSLKITWEKGETHCEMGEVIDEIAKEMEIEVNTNNAMMREQVDGEICPVLVTSTTVYFGGHAYYVQDSILYRDNESLNVPFGKLEDILNAKMKYKPFKITPDGNMFRLQTADAYEIKAAKRVCINGSFYETIDFDLAKSLPCYDKFMTFPIPENDGRFIPYCHNRVELLRVLHNINNYEDVDMRDCKFENGKWEITKHVLSRLYERVTGSSEVSNVEDIKKVIRFLDNV